MPRLDAFSGSFRSSALAASLFRSAGVGYTGERSAAADVAAVTMGRTSATRTVMISRRMPPP